MIQDCRCPRCCLPASTEHGTRSRRQRHGQATPEGDADRTPCHGRAAQPRGDGAEDCKAHQGDGHDDTDFGYSIAATAGVVVVDGLSIEADLLYSSRDYAHDDVNTYSTLSLMANAKYTVALNDTFSVYGGVGLGYVWGKEDWSSDAADYGSFGFQVIAGVGAKLTDNITAVAEYRFQDTFDKSNYKGSGDYGLSIPVSTVLAGLKFSF